MWLSNKIYWMRETAKIKIPTIMSCQIKTQLIRVREQILTKVNFLKYSNWNLKL